MLTSELSMLLPIISNAHVHDKVAYYERDFMGNRRVGRPFQAAAGYFIALRKPT